MATRERHPGHSRATPTWRKWGGVALLPPEIQSLSQPFALQIMAGGLHLSREEKALHFLREGVHSKHRHPSLFHKLLWITDSSRTSKILFPSSYYLRQNYLSFETVLFPLGDRLLFIHSPGGSYVTLIFAYCTHGIQSTLAELGANSI